MVREMLDALERRYPRLGTVVEEARDRLATDGNSDRYAEWLTESVAREMERESD